MKIHHSLLMLLLLIAAACNSNTEALRQENEALKEKAKNDSVYIASLNDEMDIVYNNLDSVKLLLDNLSQSADQLQKGSPRENTSQIKQGMVNVDSLLEENRVRIAQLEEKLSRSNNQTAYFKKMVNRLNKELAEREQTIVGLNKQLAALGQEVEGLKVENKRAGETIARSQEQLSAAERKAALAEDEAKAKTQLLNTGYYMIGTKKDLSTRGIVKTSGLLKKVSGLGDALNNEDFKKADITRDNTIDLGDDKVKEKNVQLVPERTAGQYTISKANGRTYLTIVRPEEFWRKSKYLVVVTE